MKVTIVGSGYVGLVSGVCLAAKGHDVDCVDINSEVVHALNKGTPHIYERDLEPMLREVLAAGRFRATTNLAASLVTAEIAIIAVGTPSENGKIDLRQVREVARDIGAFLKGSDRFLPVVIKSTVLPGTTDTIVRGEIEAASGKRFGAFGLGMNPEFLREGAAVSDFMKPDRVVLGHENERTLQALEALYAPWNCDKLRVNSRTAELIKYTNNALLAIQISAINEIANLADAIGNIDVMDVVEGVRLDKRWNPLTNGGRLSPAILSYLVPGCGFGGSCLPKDLRAMCAQGREKNLPMHVLNAVLKVNDAQPLKILETLEREHVPTNVTVLLLGLSFKPETDDVRESASIRIAQSLLAHGASIVAHDPFAAENFKRAIGEVSDRITFVHDWRPHVGAAAIVVVATRWPEYRELAAMDLSGKTLFDPRRMFATGGLNAARYLTIGRRMAGS